MDFFDALSLRVLSANKSRDFRSLPGKANTLAASLSRLETHHRSLLRFLASGFEKAVKQKVIFFLFFFLAKSQNSVWTELP